MTNPTWNNSEVIGGDVAAEIARRKAQTGGNIVQYGFGPVTDLLLTHRLLDELRLWVHPFMLGSGNPRLSRLPGPRDLRRDLTLSEPVVLPAAAPPPM